ncbi:hypothetical protein PAPYR_7083 [Paratrimastix pyriformis]|uniref:Uncharacterized protein n=1 Tax=Paratrimastix pyriformis TaxID=342808 RepID=A0ABQ8UDZ5_9EUKA|nr:hypothetical protein PAPYR_7083 [Paratrimastix pyriformis]
MSTDDLRPPRLSSFHHESSRSQTPVHSLSAICGCHPRDHACAERTTAFLATGAPDPSRRGVAEGGVPWTPEVPRRNTQSTGARIHVAPPDQGPHRRPGKGDAFCRRDASSCLHLGTPWIHRFMVGGIPPGAPAPPRRFDSAFCGPAMPPLPTPTQLTVPRPPSPGGAMTASVPGRLPCPNPACLPRHPPPSAPHRDFCMFLRNTSSCNRSACPGPSLTGILWAYVDFLWGLGFPDLLTPPGVRPRKDPKIKFQVCRSDTLVRQEYTLFGVPTLSNTSSNKPTPLAHNPPPNGPDEGNEESWRLKTPLSTAKHTAPRALCADYQQQQNLFFRSICLPVSTWKGHPTLRLALVDKF